MRVASEHRSTKAQDLRRNLRILVHSIITGPAGADEIKLRGTARRVEDLAVQQRYAQVAFEQLGWQPVVGSFALFSVDVDEVGYVNYHPDTGTQHVARWPADVEYQRPATTPNSLGPRQPIRKMLASKGSPPDERESART